MSPEDAAAHTQNNDFTAGPTFSVQGSNLQNKTIKQKNYQWDGRLFWIIREPKQIEQQEGKRTLFFRYFVNPTLRVYCVFYNNKIYTSPFFLIFCSQYTELNFTTLC